jgi:hypothetical protein
MLKLQSQDNLFDEATFRDDMAAETKPWLVRFLLEGGRNGNARIGIEGAFDVTLPEVDAWVQGYTYKFAAKVSASLADKLRGHMSEGLLNGEMITQLRDRVREVFGPDQRQQYSEMVARTESARAQSMGQIEAWKQSGVVSGTEWSASPDCCEWCAEMDGRMVNLGETYFDQGGSLEIPGAGGEGTRSMNFGYEEIEGPPLHPNCFPGSTICETPGRFIVGLEFGGYSGPAIELILANGARLTVTPNHLLLTRQGFARAQSLCEGDEVLYCLGFERVVGGNPDDNYGPAPIEDIVSALAETSGMAIRSVPISAEYLHGDGRFGNGDIHVIAPDSLLSGNREAEGAELLGQSNLGATDAELQTLTGSGSLTDRFIGLARVADSIMGGRREAAAFSRRRLSHPSEHSLRSVPGGDTGFEEPTADDITRNLISFGECLDGLAGIVEAQEIVGVRRFDFTGHVYDLQSDTTLYTAEGIMASNCRCVLLSVDKEPE